MENKRYLLISWVFGILIILSLNLISADVLISGKVYTADLSIVSEANVTAACYHNGTINLEYDITRVDGSYAVGYFDDRCFEYDIVKVSAVKGNYSGEMNGTIMGCEDESCQEDFIYFSIINPVITENAPVVPVTPPVIIPENNGGGGSFGGFCDESVWKCGNWSSCENENQTRVCVDIMQLQANKNETKACLPDFIPLSQTQLSEINKKNQFIMEKIGSNIVIGETDFVKINNNENNNGSGILFVVFEGLLIIITIVSLAKGFRK